SAQKLTNTRGCLRTITLTHLSIIHKYILLQLLTTTDARSDRRRITEKYDGGTFFQNKSFHYLSRGVHNLQIILFANTGIIREEKIIAVSRHELQYAGVNNQFFPVVSAPIFWVEAQNHL